MAKTLIEILDNIRTTTDRGYTFLDDQLQPQRWSFAELIAEAERRSRYFRALGLEKGDRMALIVPESEDFVLSFLGAVLAGIVPVPMYPPLALAKLDSYVDNAARVIETAGAKVLLTTKRISPILWSLLSRVDCLKEVLLAERVREESKDAPELPRVAIGPTDICFLQFTSGSTSDPKGVVVSHENLAANAEGISHHGLRTKGIGDVGVTWLPLYHDMGLIGFVIAPLVAGIPVVFIPTMHFVKRPSVWMQVINEYRGTITFAPNFAFGLAAKRVHMRNSENYDLSCLRIVGCGAEPINPKTLHAFIEAYEPRGLNPNAVMPCYGMAEATLAISFDDLQRPFRSITIDRNVYEEEHIAKMAESGDDTLDLVSCGQPFPLHEVAIADEYGRHLSEGRVGEILFRGPSVTHGYFRNEIASQEAVRSGWLHTGDLGFMLEGELYISGRKKDLIILNGRNYYPQSIEWEVEHVEGVRKGNVVAFAVRGATTEELVVVVESRSEDRNQVAQLIKTHLKDTMGLAVADAVVVPPGTLPKTSSGKLQRRKTKSLYESKTLGLGGSRAMGSAAAKVTLARHITTSAIARIKHSIRGVLSFSGRSAWSRRAPFAMRRRAESR